MDHSSKTKELLERYKGMFQNVTTRSLQVETLMTVLKMFWPIYNLEKTVIQRKGASEK